MNSGLFEVYNRAKHTMKFPHFELGHSGVTDWVLNIWEQDGIGSGAKETEVAFVQDCDLDYVLAKGEVLLKEYLIKTNDGY